MRDARGEIEATGARLVIIGNGAPAFARSFAEDHRLVGSVYTDPKRSVYRALGMKRGVRRTFTWQSAKHAIRAVRAGHRQTRTKGDPWQQGGTVVVDAKGDVAYEYKSRTPGDHAPVDEVLRAARAAAESRERAD